MSAPDDLRSVGFLGLGIMGSRMAARVARAGFPLTVWTHTPGKAAAWASGHDAVVAADTPAEVARASEIVVSMVVDGDQVDSVLLGEDGVIEAARPDLLCVDMSTIAPARQPADRGGAGRAGGADAGRSRHRLLATCRGGHAHDHGRRRR